MEAEDVSDQTKEITQAVSRAMEWLGYTVLLGGALALVVITSGF